MDWKTIGTMALGMFVGLLPLLVQAWLTRKAEIEKVRREQTADYKVQCYRDLIAALHELSFKLVLERRCRQDDRPGPTLASDLDIMNAKKAVLMAHVCGSKSLVEAAWAVYTHVLGKDPDDARTNELLCELVTKVRTDVGLELAPFDQKKLKEAEELMVASCCTRQRYEVTVRRVDGTPASAQFEMWK